MVNPVQSVFEEGWSVGLIGRNPDPLSELEKEHENAMALPCDVADADAVDASFNAFVERLDDWTPCLTTRASHCQANPLTKSM